MQQCAGYNVMLKPGNKAVPETEKLTVVMKEEAKRYQVLGSGPRR